VKAARCWYGVPDIAERRSWSDGARCNSDGVVLAIGRCTPHGTEQNEMEVVWASGETGANLGANTDVVLVRRCGAVEPSW
jgi:hypothetical protein